jgi:flagellar biosynthetic protein FliR
MVLQSGKIFEMGCMIAAPVVVALLLTNFVMGMISKVIPTINLFMLSFPLTIGIGLSLTIIALPEVGTYLTRQLLQLESLTATAVQ